MKLQPIKFGDYTFPHNPRMLKIENKRNLKKLQIPYEGEVTQDYGLFGRVVNGEGEFYGSECRKDYEKLERILKEGKTSLLSLPESSPFLADLISLELTEKPEPELIHYQVIFWEHESEDSIIKTANGFEIYFSKEGENLWEIAVKLKTTMEALMELNPQIQFPTFLKEKERVIFCEG